MGSKNNVEIERWFLVDPKDIPFNLKMVKPIQIKQWYITRRPTIRIRSENDNVFILCIKTKPTSQRGRPEFEILVSQEEFKSLIRQASTKAVQKLRFEIPFYSGTKTVLQIDQFLKPKKTKKLWKIEVEFKSEEQADKFKVPAWFGKEVTGDFKYSNAYFAEKK